MQINNLSKLLFLKVDETFASLKYDYSKNKIYQITWALADDTIKGKSGWKIEFKQPTDVHAGLALC